MRTLQNTYFGAAGMAVLALAVAGCGKNAVAAGPEVAPQKAAPVSATTPAVALTVNDLAAAPASHLGPVALVGVVGTVNGSKGFVVVDTREYKECGLTCLVEPGTKKIPVRWPGAAPAVKDTVRIDGKLTKDAKGFALVADKVAKQ